MPEKNRRSPIRTEFMTVLLDIQSRLGAIESTTAAIKETVEHHRKDAKTHILSDEQAFRALGIELQNIEDGMETQIAAHAAEDLKTFVWIKRALVGTFAILFIDLMGFREISQGLVVTAGKTLGKMFFGI
jgi:hypothetical protein